MTNDYTQMATLRNIETGEQVEFHWDPEGNARFVKNGEIMDISQPILFHIASMVVEGTQFSDDDEQEWE